MPPNQQQQPQLYQQPVYQQPMPQHSYGNYTPPQKGNSEDRKFKLIVGFSAAGLILGIIFFVLSSVTGSKINDELQELGLLYVEHSRVAEHALKAQRIDVNTEDLATTVHIVSDSNVQEVTTQLADRGTTFFVPEEPELYADFSIDERIDAAVVRNELRTEYAKIVDEQMEATKAQIINAYDQTSNEDIQAALNELFASADAIQENAQAVSN